MEINITWGDDPPFNEARLPDTICSTRCRCFGWFKSTLAEKRASISFVARTFVTTSKE